MKYTIAFYFLLLAGVAKAQPVEYNTPNGKKGFKNREGNILIPARYSEVSGTFSSGPVRVKFNNKYGYVGFNGTELIKTQYDSAGLFSSGQAEVKLGNDKFRIDTTGKRIEEMLDFSALLDSFLNAPNYFNANDLKALGKVNMVCDKFTDGDYTGEANSLDMADGYGMYVFADSSFYAGQFSGGYVNGNGVLYNKTAKTIWIGAWKRGQPTNDYISVILDDYKVQWYSATKDKPVFRSAMQITGDFVITSNMIGATTNNKRNLIEILDEKSLSTMYGAVDGDLLYHGNYASFDYPSIIKVNKANHGAYQMNVTEETFLSDNAISNAEKTLGYKFSSFIYPVKAIPNYYQNENYFGGSKGNKPEGFGAYSLPNSNFILFSSLFSNGQPTGFHQEVFNSAQSKYFYAGEFKEDIKGKDVYHSGTFAKVVYRGLNDVIIEVGDYLPKDSVEILRRGINIKINTAVSNIIFTDKTRKEEVGYLLFPRLGIIYRGGIKNEKAEGIGEALLGKKNELYMARWADGKDQMDITTKPAWNAPIFLNIFNKPQQMIDDQQ